MSPITLNAPPIISRPPRAPELVWRVQAEERAFEAVEGFVRGPAAAALPASAARAAPDWQPLGASGTQPAPFDPAWADRIAEDVISRVERRARIERERRGV